MTHDSGTFHSKLIATLRAVGHMIQLLLYMTHYSLDVMSLDLFKIIQGALLHPTEAADGNVLNTSLERKHF